MSGPEMLTKALKLAELAEGQEFDHAMFTLAQAQVYVTGALAAATMDAANGTHIRDWSHAIGGAR